MRIALPSTIVRDADDLAVIVLFSDDLVPVWDGVAMIVRRPDDFAPGTLTPHAKARPEPSFINI